MVRSVARLDRNNKIYIDKPLRQAGLIDTIEIVPCASSSDLQSGNKSRGCSCLSQEYYKRLKATAMAYLRKTEYEAFIAEARV